MRRTTAEEKTIGGVKYDEDICGRFLPCHMTRNFRIYIDGPVGCFSFFLKEEIREKKN